MPLSVRVFRHSSTTFTNQDIDLTQGDMNSSLVFTLPAIANLTELCCEVKAKICVLFRFEDESDNVCEYLFCIENIQGTKSSSKHQILPKKLR